MFGVYTMTSVVATPVAETVTTVAQEPDEMADVPIAAVPLATVCAIVALDDGNVIVVLSVPASVIELLAVSVLPAVTESPVTDVAPMVPVPVTARDAPEPTTMAAVVFVPPVIAEKADPPPPLGAFPIVGISQ